MSVNTLFPGSPESYAVEAGINPGELPGDAETARILAVNGLLNSGLRDRAGEASVDLGLSAPAVEADAGVESADGQPEPLEARIAQLVAEVEAPTQA